MSERKEMKLRTGQINGAGTDRSAPVDDRQLLEAIVLSMVQYRVACRRFKQRLKVRGFDYRCSRLLDQIALRKSLLLLLAAEARKGASLAI